MKEMKTLVLTKVLGRLKLEEDAVEKIYGEYW